MHGVYTALQVELYKYTKGVQSFADMFPGICTDALMHLNNKI